MTPADYRNLGRFNLLVIGWSLVFGVATVVLRNRAFDAVAVGVALVALHAALGIATLFAYLRFLRDTDELQRRIHLEGIGLGFGAGVVFSLSYRLAERIGAPELDTTDPLLVFVLFWALGQWLAVRRYR
jgi:hypothetical protein